MRAVAWLRWVMGGAAEGRGYPRFVLEGGVEREYPYYA